MPRKKKTHQQACYIELSAMPKGLGGHFSANSAPRINGFSVRKRPYGKRNLLWVLTSKWLGLYKLNLVTAQWAKKMTQKEINPKPAGCGKISFQQASVGLPTPNGQAPRSKHKQTRGAKSPSISIENYICSLTTSLEHIVSDGCDCRSHKRM